ncbi:MAG: hypothetical protein ACPHPA_04245 [Cycloclasticus pugetii]|jgi:hypothetical protein|uniref:Uncharacterized protein n=1 Tax=Cycloclasticus pugetii TaxID=34068 RepID=A0AB33YZU7_9GAMM|nr:MULTISPECIES: hypothetical protein [Cycloclasticus]ATI03226.1 hypothetical protein CPC19_06990 [Cycloclasticus sp. PY97N]EPD12666.1 hypothetical protein L196_08674 [Cycloclasticus pugetii]
MTDNNYTNNEHIGNPLPFQAAFDKDKMRSLENNMQSNAQDDAVNRRIALGVLTRSSDELISSMDSDKDKEAFVTMVECIGGTIEAEKGKLELLEAARARLFLVLEAVLDADTHEPLPE